MWLCAGAKRGFLSLPPRFKKASLAEWSQSFLTLSCRPKC